MNKKRISNFGATINFSLLMENTENENIDVKVKRPKLLSFLCILTFIFTGLGCLSSIVTPLTADIVKQYMMSAPNYDEATMGESLKIIGAGWGYYILTFLLTLGSMIGAILMWRLRKTGFHVYAFSNLAILFVPTLVLDITISWYAIFFTLSFIGLYAFHLKFMK